MMLSVAIRVHYAVEGADVQLFRSEALRGYNRLHGEVSMAPPVSWQLLGLFLVATLMLALTFLSLAGYAERVSATGSIASDRGVPGMLPPRSGTIASLLVHEGDRVHKGQVLAQIALATAAGSDTLEARRKAALAQQAQALAGRVPALMAGSAARVIGLEAQIASDRTSLANMDQQIADQQALLTAATEDLDRAREIAKGGFVSRNDIRAREEKQIAQHQALTRLQQARADLVSRIDVNASVVRRESADLALSRLDVAQAEAQVAGLDASDAAQAQVDVIAPASGTVTGVAGTVGGRAEAGRPLLSIVPANAHLVVRLAIPAAGIGFVRPGQSVAIALDAFPREIFGMQRARLTYVTVARVPTADAASPAFLAEALLERPYVLAYGARQPLRPGMTLSATIVTQRLSLIRWLLDPLFAVMDR